jgi:hypothetical protein
LEVFTLPCLGIVPIGESDNHLWVWLWSGLSEQTSQAQIGMVFSQSSGVGIEIHETATYS